MRNLCDDDDYVDDNHGKPRKKTLSKSNLAVIATAAVFTDFGGTVWTNFAPRFNTRCSGATSNSQMAV